MSGSIGGKRIKREEVQPTLDKYISQVLSKVPGFVSAEITGSYNAGTRKDHGDIDLAVHIKGTNVAQVKKEFKAQLDTMDLPEFVFGKNQGKKSQMYGAIVTCGFPIAGREEDYVQIDNIIVTNENEQKFQRKFLDLDAAKQGLIMGVMRVILHYKNADKILNEIGLVDLPKPSGNQEYEFVLSSAGLSFRLVTLNSEMKETAREELWRSANWDLVEYILNPLDLTKSYEELLNQVAKMVKNDNRSKRRIVGIMKSMIRVGPGEVGTPKGDGKIAAIERAETMLKESSNIMGLKEFIMENIKTGNIEELKDSIIQRIMNSDMDTLIRVKSLFDRLGVNMDELKAFLDSRNLQNCAKMILSIFNDCNDIDALVKQMGDNPCQITSREFLANNNVYDLFNNVCKKETIDALYNLRTPDSKSIARGDYEVLLNLFLYDIDGSKVGDIPSKESGSIEIKSKDGALKSQRAYNVAACDKKFAEYFREYNLQYKDIFNGWGQIFNILRELDELQIDRQFILRGIAESWVAKYPGSDNGLVDAMAKFLIEKQDEIFQIPVKKKTARKNLINVGIILDAFMVADFIKYKEYDKWSNLVVFSKEHKGYYQVVEGNAVENMKFGDLYVYLMDKHIERTTNGTKLNDRRYDATKIKYENIIK